MINHDNICMIIESQYFSNPNWPRVTKAAERSAEDIEAPVACLADFECFPIWYYTYYIDIIYI